MMKKLVGLVAIGSLLMFLVQWLLTYISLNPMCLLSINQNNNRTAKQSDRMIYNLFEGDFFSDFECFMVWTQMKDVLKYSQTLPNALQAITEARFALDSLISSNGGFLNSSDRQCPINTMNVNDEYILKIPCGFVQGNSISFVRISKETFENFQIELIGKSESEQKVLPIFRYFARLNGTTNSNNSSVSVEYSWSVRRDGCPASSVANNEKVDNNATCEMKPTNASVTVYLNHFRHEFKSELTVKMEEEMIKMTVDNTDIVSFPISESLNPWLVTEVKISGSFKPIHFKANLSRNVTAETKKELELFIGVFSLSDNFQRRMAIRRTWMQYPVVRSGMVAVRFFVGMHKDQWVNEAIWKEANTYRDIQLMPWVDNYNLITLKTAAICIYASQFVTAKYIMKTDDDAFVRVDQILASLNKANVTSGMLYGLVNSFDFPDRNPLSKWYITAQEWHGRSYPPYAQGPGYVISHDIATAVNRMHRNGTLKMFKLEDVGMGIWIEQMKKQGMSIHYIPESRKKIIAFGCEKDYMVAHYQNTRQLQCLWKKLQKYKVAECCNTNTKT